MFGRRGSTALPDFALAVPGGGTRPTGGGSGEVQPNATQSGLGMRLGGEDDVWAARQHRPTGLCARGAWWGHPACGGWVRRSPTECNPIRPGHEVVGRRRCLGGAAAPPYRIMRSRRRVGAPGLQGAGPGSPTECNPIRPGHEVGGRRRCWGGAAAPPYRIMRSRRRVGAPGLRGVGPEKSNRMQPNPAWA